MLDDRLQFAISQYLDGTLPPEERAALEQCLAAGPEARQFLEEERRLNALLQSSAPAMPAVNWDRLHEHLSAAVAEQEDLAEVSRYRIGWVRHVRALAVAAVVLLLVGAAVVAYLTTAQTDTGRPVAIVDVRVLEPAAPAGPVVAEVSIGPSPMLADTGGGEYPLHDAGGVVSRPSFVMIATAERPAQDTRIYAH